MLTPGEFVINASATQANLGLLQSINTRGAAQRFANGGPVSAYPIKLDEDNMHTVTDFRPTG